MHTQYRLREGAREGGRGVGMEPALPEDSKLGLQASPLEFCLYHQGRRGVLQVPAQQWLLDDWVHTVTLSRAHVSPGRS